MRNLTFANQITILRIVLIPAFVLLVVYGRLGEALLVFMTAGATDALDGLIARRAGQRTSLGAWLDPMADKLLLVTTFIVLTLPAIDLTNHLPLWLTIIVISRDVVIVGVVAIVNLAVGPRTFRPSLLGKATTAVFIVASVVIMYFNYRRETSILVDLGIWLSLALTLVSSADYFFKLRRLINEPT
ncbi:MAG TPA: CDP-alcohol phosphatidyltransferase family protein [Vicinamibacterales bacterium]|nr:CDP-alcohol phosphatidyltransferase family protein [Vicinamibacterales bacterium]